MKIDAKSRLGLSMAAFGSPEALKSGKDAPETRLKAAPEMPKSGQEAPKSAQEATKRGPGASQHPPKTRLETMKTELGHDIGGKLCSEGSPSNF